MTHAQMEAARARVRAVIRDEYPDVPVGDYVCRRLVTAVLGHPDGKAPKVARKPQPGRGTRLRFSR